MILEMTPQDYNHHYERCVGWIHWAPHKQRQLVLFGTMDPSGEGLHGSVLTALSRWDPVRIHTKTIISMDYKWPRLGYLQLRDSPYLYRMARVPNYRTFLVGAHTGSISGYAVSAYLDPVINALSCADVIMPAGVPLPTRYTPNIGESLPRINELEFLSPQILTQIFAPDPASLELGVHIMEYNLNKAYYVINTYFCLHRLVSSGDTLFLVYKSAIVGTASSNSGVVLYADCAYLVELVGRTLGATSTITERPRAA